MYKGDGHRLLEDLKVKYLKTDKGQYPVPERYAGTENEKVDWPFTMMLLWTVIDESNKNSAPGKDAITYKLLEELPLDWWGWSHEPCRGWTECLLFLLPVTEDE
ncbi:hypothetical protein MRX96_048052 [Rhipicephalus microplus]